VNHAAIPRAARVKRLAITALAFGIAGCASHDQLPDRDYAPAVARPMYAAGAGPVVCVDEKHHNFHTLGERFAAFGGLLRRDGYRPVASAATFDARMLEACDVLVISNAQPNDDEWDRYPIPTPSAFTSAEIAAVREWVDGGGALLLIADHQPLAGAAAKLASAFGVEFTDGFARREPDHTEPDIFRLADGTLRAHAITAGRDARESVASVRTFRGQAFRAPLAEPLIVLPAGWVNLMPEKAWEFTDATPRLPAEGWLQGAVQTVGKGRAAFFGEAAMFSAQRVRPDGRPIGMNAPGAESNFQFVLNVMHWLTRKL
jgi:hypothetical protein